MRFTDAKLKGLKPKKARYIIWEEGGKGLGIRVSPSGRKSFIFMYRFDGRARMMTLGSFLQISLADANVRVAKAKKQLTQDIDPGKEWIEKKYADRTGYSVRNLVEEYLEKWAKPRKKSWKEDERILKKDVLSIWGRKKAKDIKRRDIVLLLDEIVDRGAPIQANRVLAVIRKMFNFALSRSILETSPCVAITAPGKERRRDRVLNDEEIHKLWHRLPKCQMAEGTRLILKLLLTTAQRKGELATAEWSEFDLKKGWWTIPAEKAKNSLPHRVPLTPLAIEQLNQAKQLSNGLPWVFPGNRNGSHITPPAIDHAIRNNQSVLELSNFTPHDLRRTAASNMTSLKTSRLVVAKILNHVESGITAVYDRYSYDDEKRKALKLWERKLSKVINRKPGKT